MKCAVEKGCDDMKRHRPKIGFKTVVFWQFLRRSRIFNSWYKTFLNGLLFDIQGLDIDQSSVMDKYQKKLDKARNYKAAIK